MEDEKTYRENGSLVCEWTVGESVSGGDGE